MEYTIENRARQTGSNINVNFLRSVSVEYYYWCRAGLVIGSINGDREVRVIRSARALKGIVAIDVALVRRLFTEDQRTSGGVIVPSIGAEFINIPA